MIRYAGFPMPVVDAYFREMSHVSYFNPYSHVFLVLQFSYKTNIFNTVMNRLYLTSLS